jgi:hypothetical protein
LFSGKKLMIRSRAWWLLLACMVAKTSWPVRKSSRLVQWIRSRGVRPLQDYIRGLAQASSRQQTSTASVDADFPLCDQALFVGCRIQSGLQPRRYARVFWLIQSTIAAKVVDFPAPVAPAEMIKPRLFSAIVFSAAGKPSASKLGGTAAIARKTMPT